MPKTQMPTSLRAMLDNRGLSAVAFSNLSGVPICTLYGVLKGARPHTATLTKMAKALRVRPATLRAVLEGGAEPKP